MGEIKRVHPSQAGNVMQGFGKANKDKVDDNEDQKRFTKLIGGLEEAPDEEYIERRKNQQDKCQEGEIRAHEGVGRVDHDIG